jgi:hypothetical protein
VWPAGATEITAVDMHPFPLDNARALGASRTLLATAADAIASVQADVVVESSGSHRGLASQRSRRSVLLPPPVGCGPAAVDVGFRPHGQRQRPWVSGKPKTEAKQKLLALRRDQSDAFPPNTGPTPCEKPSSHSSSMA